MRKTVFYFTILQMLFLVNYNLLLLQVEAEELNNDSNITSVENDLNNLNQNHFEYTYDGMTFTSLLSEDDAWYKAISSPYKNGELTNYELNEMYDDFTKRNIDVSNFSSSNSDFYNNEIEINFTFCFEYLTNGKIVNIPLKRMKVELCEKDLIENDVLATGYTDELGQISFLIEDVTQIIDNDFRLYAKVSAESYTFKMTKDWDLYILPDYYFIVNVCEDTSKNVYNINPKILYNENNRVHCAFIASQGMEMGQRAALDMGMNIEGILNVLIPICTNEIDSFCYDLYSGIVIRNYEDYYDFDVLIHEYAHYIQHMYDAYNISLNEIINYNPVHSFVADHFSCNNHNNNNDFAMKLAWTEAWATTFSEIVQNLYYNDFLDTTTGKTYFEMFGDCYYYCPTAMTLKSIEDFTSDDNSNEAQEVAITAFLWDLFDNELMNNCRFENEDQISLNFDVWWHLTLNTNISTFNDFYMRLLENRIDISCKVSELLSYHHISSYQVLVTNKHYIDEDTTPQICFFPGGSINSPNTKFKIVFLNSSFFPLYESDFIYSTGVTNISVNDFITDEDWIAFINRFSYDFNFYIVIKSYNQSNQNQWYYSQYNEINFYKSEHICGFSASYEQFSANKHKSICSCGNYKYDFHVVKPQGIQRYKPCIYCGYLVDTDSTISEVNPLKFTNNIDIIITEKKEDDFNETN